MTDHPTPYAARRTRDIVDAARASHPFYRRWIPDPAQPPILDRATFLAHNDELLLGRPATGATSGSTGVPVRFAQSDEWRRVAGEDGDRFIRQLGGALPVVRLVHVDHDAPANTLSVATPLDVQLAFIAQRRRDHGAAALITYPTHAETLARAALDRGLDMSFVRRFGLIGEHVEPAHRAIVERAFPAARVWTTYSSLEFGLIASMCPFEPSFHHINAHRLGVEVLLEDGRPAPDGVRGRVIITDYLNRLTPFIRYEIGDLAARGRCPCGRIPLPAFAEIHGKVRGALLHRSGERVLFADLSVQLRDLPGMRQYQVIQHDLDTFTVRVVADRRLDAEIRAALAAHFGAPVEVRVEAVDAIPRGPNGKFYASICEL
jgi:phenylacetate-coenzyme A ligase PaaK-like adenylate-forming protein